MNGLFKAAYSCRQSRLRRRHPHKRRHQAAVGRAFIGATLLLGRSVTPTSQREAATMVASTIRDVTAAATLLQAEDERLINRVMRGQMSLLAAAELVEKRAALLSAYRAAPEEDRIAVVKTIDPGLFFDEVLVPAATAN